MQLIALIIETPNTYLSGSSNNVKNLKNHTVTGSVSMLTEYICALVDVEPRLRSPGEASSRGFFTKAGEQKRLSGSQYGVSLTFNSFRNLPIMTFDMLTADYIKKIAGIYGWSAPAVFAPLFLVLIWFCFFLFIGFVSLERSRVVLVLLLLLATLLFIY